MYCYANFCGQIIEICGCKKSYCIDFFLNIDKQYQDRNSESAMMNYLLAILFSMILCLEFFFSKKMFAEIDYCFFVVLF